MNSAISFGALFQYAFLQVKENVTTQCGNGVDCSGSVVRVGLQGAYHFVLDSLFTPWVGLGVGYEWLTVDVSEGTVSGSVEARGFEFLTLQGGADYRLSQQFSIGPFASFSIARYETATLNDTNGTSMSMDIPNTAVHEWLQLGVRGTFNL